MIHYGVILDIFTLAVLNVIGGVLNVVYTALYLLVVKDKVSMSSFVKLISSTVPLCFVLSSSSGADP